MKNLLARKLTPLEHYLNIQNKCSLMIVSECLYGRFSHIVSGENHCHAREELGEGIMFVFCKIKTNHHG